MSIDSISDTTYVDPFDDVSVGATISSAQWNGKFNTCFAGIADLIETTNLLVAWHNGVESDISDLLSYAAALQMSSAGFLASAIVLTPGLAIADNTATQDVVSIAASNDDYHCKFQQAVECDLIAPDADGLDIENSAGDTTLTINGNVITSSSGSVNIEGVEISGASLVSAPGFPHSSSSIFTYGGGGSDDYTIPSEYSFAKATLTGNGTMNLYLPADRPSGDVMLVECDNQASVSGSIVLHQSDGSTLETIAAGDHKVFFLLRIYSDGDDFYTVFTVDK